MGFDYVIFDESHFLKKVITDCKGRPTGNVRQGAGTSMRDTRKYEFGEGEFPSTIALIGYFITRYIQDNNNQKNVFKEYELSNNNTKIMKIIIIKIF